MNRTAHIDRFHIDEGFVEHQEVVIGETRQLHGLHARAGVRDDVPVLLEDALQRPAHPIVAAGNQGERRTVLGQFHRGSSSVARLAWRFHQRFSLVALRRHLSVGLPVFGGANPTALRASG